MYLWDLFNERSTNYDLCNPFCNMTLSRPRTDKLQRSFSYSGAFLWNSFPENVREIRSIGKLKKRINCVFESLDSHSVIL